MQVIGWISILIGMLYFRKVSGILLIIIGIVVVYIVRKSKKNETELTRRVFQAQIKKTGRIKKVLGIARQESKRDFPTNALPTIPNIKSKVGEKQKTDWLIYTK
jgi:nucleoside permease NupC